MRRCRSPTSTTRRPEETCCLCPARPDLSTTKRWSSAATASRPNARSGRSCGQRWRLGSGSRDRRRGWSAPSRHMPSHQRAPLRREPRPSRLSMAVGPAIGKWSRPTGAMKDCPPGVLRSSQPSLRHRSTQNIISPCDATHTLNLPSRSGLGRWRPYDLITRHVRDDP